MTAWELLESGLHEMHVSFSPQAVERLLLFSDLLLEKNKVMNLTAVTRSEEVITRHFLDCAALVPWLKAGQSVLDVGTGAGFPVYRWRSCARMYSSHCLMHSVNGSTF